MKQMTKTRWLTLLLALTLLLGTLPAPAHAEAAQFAASSITGSGSAFELMSEDEDGNTIPVAAAKHKGAVRILLPLKCKTEGVTALSVTPELGSVDIFPFKVTKQDYAKRFPDEWSSSIVEDVPIKDVIYYLSFHFSIHDDATKGTKMVTFTIRYTKDGSEYEQYLTIPVDVLDNPPSMSSSSSSGGSSSGYRLAPKVIVDSFSFDPIAIFAGETFELALDLINTSDREAVRNMQVSVSDSTGAIMPANNGSNSQFIDRIEMSGSKKGNRASLIFPMQVMPDAEQKAVLLTVDIVYNGASTKQEYKATESIAVPVQQKLRVKFSDPVIYDDAWVDQSVSASVQLFNLGKSPVYNTTVEVEGQGIEMEESYFGGNVSPGTAMRAEFNIIPHVGGEIRAEVVIAFEDIYGNITEERLPLKLFVNDVQQMDVMPMEDFMPEEVAPVDETIRILGLPWYVPAAVLTAIILIVTLLIARAKRKRTRELMDR